MNPNNSNANNNSLQGQYNSLHGQNDFRQRYQQDQAAGMASQGTHMLKQSSSQMRLGGSQQIRCPVISNMQNYQLPSKDFCKIHNQQLVGVDQSTNEVLCNGCIYSSKHGKLQFTALVSNSLKNQFMQKLMQYDQSKQSVNELDSTIIKQTLVNTANSFFNNLQQKVKELEIDVTSRIKNSDSLKELYKTLEANKELFIDQNQPNQFETEKKVFDEQVQRGRFATVVNKRQFYNELIEKINTTCQKMKQTIDQSSAQLQRVLKLQAPEALIRQSFGEIVKDCIMIDNEKVSDLNVMRQPNMENRSVNGAPNAGSMQEQNTQRQNIFQSNQNQQQQQRVHQQMPFLNLQQSSQNQHIQNHVPQQQATRINMQVPPQSPQQSFNQAQPQSQNSQLQQLQQQTQPTFQSRPQSLFPQTLSQQPQTAFTTLSPQKQQSDDVSIVGVGFSRPAATQQQGVIQPEHCYPTLYKLKSMTLLKLIPNKGWAKIYEIPQLFMAKCVYTHDDRIFVIGGARDNKTKETLKDCLEFKQLQGQLQATMLQRAPMIDSRASFGVVLCPALMQIYVAGGYVLGEVSKKCERYSIVNDQWTPLPELSEAKCSVSLCTLDNKYLYAIGGLSKTEGQISLISTIERVDIMNPTAQWQTINVNMPDQACDVGCLPLSKDEIMVFGGWNKTAVQNCYIIRKTELPATFNQNLNTTHELKHVDRESQIEKGDFFLVSGFGMKTEHPNQVKVCGHSQLFTLDVKQKRFVGTSNV